MKTLEELKTILSAHGRIDAHVHTHLCDGKSEMTVENIAARALDRSIDLVILTPHFHKKVSDGSDTLYEDTDEGIFLALREEIDGYNKRDGRVELLLSTEADIISYDGESSLNISPIAERALDMVTPTLNYHPLLPLSFVRLTYGKCVNELHVSGDYRSAAESLGGVSRVLETMYETEINAIERSEYPSMLGHFFMPHSVHPDKYNCFGATAEHLDIMKRGACGVIEACKRKGVMIDLSGVHMRYDETVDERLKLNGFLVDFQRYVIRECIGAGVPFCFGSDAHSLRGIGYTDGYYLRVLQSAMRP